MVAGKNELRVVAKKGTKVVEDSTSFLYQTETWGKPAEMKLSVVKAGTVEVTLHDAKGVLCLDAKNVVRFSVAGDAKLIDNQGTPWGSRVVQLANGRARISLSGVAGKNVVAVASDTLPTATVEI